MSYSYEISEYSYYAAELIFGKSNAKHKISSIYMQETFTHRERLNIVERSNLNTENHLETTRTLVYANTRYLISSHTNMKSGINNIITYVDRQLPSGLSDQVFADDEFEYYAKNWDRQVMSKVHSLGTLIRALRDRRVLDMPLLLTEFLCISKTLFEYGGFWVGEKKEGSDAVHG